MVRRRPPPPSASPGRPSVRAKDYTTHRGSAVQDELDELRNRGVAKFMNQHFTQTSKQLAKEKAEADAALADLERRRANTSEFVPSHGGGELNPYDSLYVELQQRRADCRRKEKETMLLYQRYVHKFKKKTSPSPASPPLQPQKEEEEEEEEEEVEDQTMSKLELSSPVSTPMRSPPPPSPLPGGQSDPPGKSPSHKIRPMESLDETVESTQQESAVNNLQFDKFHEEQSTDREEAEPEATTNASSNSSPVIENGTSDDPAVENKDQPLPEVVVESPKESQGEVPEAIEEPVAEHEEEGVAENGKHHERNDVVVTNLGTGIAFTEEKRPAIEVTTEIPTETTAEETEDDDGDDYDQRSIISGLTTVNSAVTRQVMEQLEADMEFFIKNETEAIQKLLDAEDANSYLGSLGGSPINSAASVACDQSVRASMKAEAMAEEMKQILDSFEKEEMSVNSRNGADSSVVDGDEKDGDSKTSEYPRKYPTSNPNEEWMIYYDAKFGREYYHETKSNCTQWEPPSSSRSKAKIDLQRDFTPVSSPRGGGLQRKMSRSDLYRRKLRRRRLRRIFVLSFLVGSALISVLHWQINHAGKSYPEAMKLTATDVGTSISNLKESIKDKYEYTFTDRAMKEMEHAENLARLEREKKAKEEARRRKQQQEEEQRRKEKLERERKEKEEALRIKKAQEEEERKRQLAARKKAQEEEARRKEREEKQRLEQERLEAERRAKEEAESKQRPAGCHLPLSHIFHKRCRQLARTNPIYSEDEILNSFLQ